MTAEIDSLNHRYSAFGLTVGSEFAIPELFDAASDSAVDVTVVMGDVPDEIPNIAQRGVRFQCSPDALRLEIDDVATFLIEGGKRIVVKLLGAPDEMRLFLLGSAIAAVLHQRGDLVLHGSAVVVDGEAVVFTGMSGAGKSTTANALRKAGYRLLADDLTIVRPGPDGRMLAFPGFPRTKLWPDSLKKLDIALDDLDRVRPLIEKRVLPVADVFHTEPVPIRKIYTLVPRNDEEIEFVSITGPAKAAVLKKQTYRFAFLGGIGNRGNHFRHVLKLGEMVPLVSIRRPNGQFQLDELIQRIRDDFQS